MIRIPCRKHLSLVGLTLAATTCMLTKQSLEGIAVQLVVEAVVETPADDRADLVVEVVVEMAVAALVVVVVADLVVEVVAEMAVADLVVDVVAGMVVEEEALRAGRVPVQLVQERRQRLAIMNEN